MAYLSGTAANHVDLLDRLVTFLSTGLGADNWTVLRYTGVAEIDASSYLVNYEPWTAVKGPYHQHANGWMTAAAQATPSWWSFKLVQPMDLARLSLKGSPTAAQSPRDFVLQYSDDGVTWADRQVFAGVTWAASEIKEWTLDPWAGGAHAYWRIYITANNGNTDYTRFDQLILNDYVGTSVFNHARRPAAWLQAPGMTGLDPVFVAFQVYDRPTSDYYNIAITGSTGFVDGGDFDTAQPGVATAMAIPLWNQATPFWLTANGQRVVVSAKVSTVYLSAYAGKILTYGTPGQYPYPLLIGAPLPTASATRFDNAAVTLPYKGNRTNMKLRKSDGTWIQPYAWPYTIYSGTTPPMRPVAGAYPLLPITLYDTTNTYGQLDGVTQVSGFSNASENTVTAGGIVHTCLQDVSRTGISDFFAQRNA